MNAECWEKVQTIFHEAVILSEPERTHYLEVTCSGDAEILTEVRKMLEADSRGDSIIERGLPVVAYRFVGPSQRLRPASEIGPYRVIEFLGEGGMGVVYMAEHQRTGKRAAIKLLVSAGMSPARLARFTHEIKVQASLAHPGIAAQYDAGTLDDGTPWFAMEYVKGQHFLEYCREHVRTLDQRLELFLAVCKALQYLHGKAIIHRDLKPSNILVDENGTPRILDFGIAKELEDLEGADERTRPELRLMTREYAAPEWIEHGQVDLSTDVFSLGVIFYEMIAGERPAGITKLPAKVDLNQRVRRELQKICQKALQADPKERYRTVEELIRDINHFRRNEPLEVQPPSAWYRVEKFVVRNRTWVIAAALTVALFVGMAVFFALRLAKERNSALAEAGRTRRIQSLLLNMLNGGVRAAAPSQDLRVLTVIDRATQEADKLRKDPATQAELYQTLAEMYRMLGRLDKSGDLHKLALEKTKAAWGSGDPRVADNLIQMGMLSEDEGKLKDGERLIEEGISVASRRLPADDIQVHKGKAALGQVLVSARSYDKAIGILNPIIVHPPVGDEETEVFLQSLSALGTAELYAGQYQRAEDCYRRALDGSRKFYGNAHPFVAYRLADLGALALSLGRVREGETLYREGVKVAEAWYGESNPDVAQMKSILASALVSEDKLDEARTLLLDILDMQEKIYGGPHPYVAFTLHSLGRLAVKQGDWAAAEDYLGRALEMQRRFFGNSEFSTGVVANNFADVLIEKKQFQKAELVMREAVAAMTANPHPGNPSVGVAEVKLGRVLLR